MSGRVLPTSHGPVQHIVCRHVIVMFGQIFVMRLLNGHSSSLERRRMLTVRGSCLLHMATCGPSGLGPTVRFTFPVSLLAFARRLRSP